MTSMNHEDFMKIAIEEAKKGDHPFGAVLIKDNQVVSQGHNTVVKDSDPSAHAEINTIRKFTTKVNNPSLEGYVLYSSGEPCPMCIGACIWAGISEIVFAVSIQDLIQAQVPQINLPCEDVIAKGTKNIIVTKGILREECLQLFK